MNNRSWFRRTLGGSQQEALKIWGPAVLVTLLGFVLAWRYVEPAPPDHLRIAAGDASGAYYHYASQYRDILSRHGITLEVVETSGSVDNARRLDSGACDLGFVQGGVGSAENHRKLRSLASVYFEPLWIFYRRNAPLERLSDLKGRRLAIGEDGSGTQLLARQLLSDNGVDDGTADLVALNAEQGGKRLRSGDLDAAMFVSSAQTPQIGELLHANDIRLLSIRRHLAYQTRYRFLSGVVLGEGAVDLKENIPAADTTLLAPAAILVVRDDFHHALVTPVLGALEEVHHAGGLFEDPGQFPSDRHTEFPLRPEAKRYLEQGPSFLYRFLPFEAAALANRLRVLLLPLLTLLIPLLRVAPPLYRWRIRSKIYRWYRNLRELDLKLDQKPGAVDFQEEITKLDELDRELNSVVNVPLSYMDEFYHLRSHVALVRRRLRRLAKQDEPDGTRG